MSINNNQDFDSLDCKSASDYGSLGLIDNFSIFKMDVFPILILQYVVSFIQCQFRSEKG